MPTGHPEKTTAKCVDAFVIEDDEDTRVDVSTALQDLGLSVRAFDNAGKALAAVDEGAPKIIFLDIALEQSDAVDVIKGLGQRHYSGTVQLFSSHPRLLDAIRRIAVRYRLKVSPPIPKPLRRETITQIIAAARITGARAATRAH